jgi:hypothetical protein
MTFRNSTHEGVRHVVLDNLGNGTVTVEPGVQPDLVECSINAGQEEFLNAVQVRQERDWLRISFPVRTFRNTNAHLRLGVPPDLEYVIKVGSADVSVSADMGRSKINSGSGSISVGRTRDLETTTGSVTCRPVRSAVRAPGWRRARATSPWPRPGVRWSRSPVLAT